MKSLMLLFALLAICSAGFGITLLIYRRRGKILLAELLCYSWLFGTTFVSATSWALSLILLQPFIALLVAAGCLLLGLAGFKLLRSKRVRIEWPRPPTRIEGVLCALIAVQFAILLWMAATTSMASDGLFRWDLKARFLFYDQGRIPAAYFGDAHFDPEDPLFISQNEAWLYFWMGGCDQFLVRSFFPIFYFVCALLIYSGVAQLAGSRVAGLMAAAALFFVPEHLNAPGSILSGYADFPLATFYVAAVVQLLLFLRDGSPDRVTLFALLAAALPWIKRDGDVSWLVFMAAGIVAAGIRRRSLPAFLGAAVPGLVVIATWALFIHCMHIPKWQDFHPVSLGLLQQNIGRIGPIKWRLCYELLDQARWSILWPGFAAALLYLAFTKRPGLALLLFLLVLAPVAILCMSYLFSAWPDYTRHVDSSISRLVLKSSPLAVFTIGLSLAKPRAEP